MMEHINIYIKSRMANSRCLKGQTLLFFTIVILNNFHCFSGILRNVFFRNEMSESAKICRVGLPIPH